MNVAVTTSCTSCMYNRHYDYNYIHTTTLIIIYLSANSCLTMSATLSLSLVSLEATSPTLSTSSCFCLSSDLRRESSPSHSTTCVCVRFVGNYTNDLHIGLNMRSMRLHRPDGYYHIAGAFRGYTISRIDR